MSYLPKSVKPWLPMTTAKSPKTKARRCMFSIKCSLYYNATGFYTIGLMRH